VELVLRAKTEEVRTYYKSHSSARGSWGGGRNVSHGGSCSAGASAANNARLSSPKGLSR
jgi:hypothetical protein